MRNTSSHSDTGYRFKTASISLERAAGSPVPELGSVDELLNRAFDLAYFILGDRPASIYVAMTAMNKLKTASTNQGRRLYYTPTGRSAYPAVRTKVSLSDLHLLQRLVYIESELFERLIEGQRKTISQADLIIRYIKHLVRITTKHNSFYVTLGLCRLLYNYSTSETSDIYNLVLQDPERIRDDYYYRSRKKRLMEDIKDRFGDLVRTQRGRHREERFLPQADSQKYASLVKECLTRFTPWRSACVLPNELDPNGNVITQLLFAGEDPDQEHEIELNRIHTLIHPECLQRLTRALRLDPVDERLELPSFFISNDGAPPTDERFNPTRLTEDELDAIKRYLDKNALFRKSFSPTHLRLLIDRKSHTDFELNHSRSVNFDLEDGSELIEISSIGPLEADEETSLSVCLLKYDRSGVVPAHYSLAVGKGQRLSIAISPLALVSGESQGATLKVDYHTAMLSRPFLASISLLREWLSVLVGFNARENIRKLRPAMALLFLALCGAGLWFYLHSGRGATKPSEVAQLEAPSGTEVSPLKPPPLAAKDRSESAAPGTEIRARQADVSTPTKDVTTGGPKRTEELEKVRGTEPRVAPVTLRSIRRVYFDPLGNDSFSRQLREELIGSLRASKRFELVSNRDDADAVFRGSAKQALEPGSSSLVILELVDAGGHIVWSLSSRKEGRVLSSDATAASASIWDVLSRNLRMVERRH